MSNSSFEGVRLGQYDRADYCKKSKAGRSGADERRKAAYIISSFQCTIGN